MQTIIDNPRSSLAAGLIIAAILLVAAVGIAGPDAFGFFSFLFRFVHVLAAMIWVGLVVFVNFVQLVAIQAGDEQQRGVLHKAIVPHVAWWFRHASTVTVATGALLLFMTGYILPVLAYGTSVYMAPVRELLLWTGVLGALAMWMFVHMYIWPNIQIVLGLRPGEADAKARARARVIMFARLNLIIAVPVLLAMIAAAHLF